MAFFFLRDAQWERDLNGMNMIWTFSNSLFSRLLIFFGLVGSKGIETVSDGFGGFVRDFSVEVSSAMHPLMNAAQHGKKSVGVASPVNI